MNVPGVRVVAICDLNPDTLNAALGRAKEAGHRPDSYADYRKMLERKDIDAIVIATLTNAHKDMAIAKTGQRN